LERGGEVDGNGGIPFGAVEVEHFGHGADARAVDEDVDGAEALDAVRDDLLRQARLRDVRRHELVPASLALDEAAGLAVVVDDARDEHVRARPGERDRERPTETGVAAGDQGVPAVEAEQIEREVRDPHRPQPYKREGTHGSPTSPLLPRAAP